MIPGAHDRHTCSVCGLEFRSSKLHPTTCSMECAAAEFDRKHPRNPRRYVRDPALPGVNAVGAASELAVAAQLLLAGWNVFRNLSPSGPCDLIAIKGGKTMYIQVKTSAVSLQEIHPMITHVAIHQTATGAIKWRTMTRGTTGQTANSDD